MAHHYVAIDLGAESGRVMLGSLEGGRLALEEIHRFSNAPVRLAGTLRWDALRLWEEIKDGLRKIANTGLHVESVSVDSWGLDYVLMRGTEPMLRAPFCYRDARTDTAYALRDRLGERAIYEATGLQFIPINTLYQFLAEDAADPELFRGADRFLMIGDWFHFLLSGRAAQEESNASTTQLWDPRRRAWSDSLINGFGLPRHIFPDVVPPCTRLGKITATMQSETTLNKVEVIAGCVHDTGAAVAAVPSAGGEHWAYLSSGTWSLIGVELPSPLITEDARKTNFTNETGVAGTSRFLRNASGLWILQECRRAWSRAGTDLSYGELTRLASDAPPFRSLVNPNDPRFLRPSDMPAAVREYCLATGQPAPETPGQFARCALESLALLYREMLDVLERTTARSITTLHIVGGGSKNELLNQLAADSTGRTVIAGPVEATAIGNLLLQALTLGHLRDHAAVRETVRASFPVRTFTPAPGSEWGAAHARFAKLTA